MSPDHKAFAAMLAESARRSLPLGFVADLTKHDRSHLATVDPSVPFVWCLYERGTHLATLDPWARELSMDVGLERNDLYKTFNLFLLPRPENRSGHELRCEVVRASDPLTGVRR